MGRFRRVPAGDHSQLCGINQLCAGAGFKQLNRQPITSMEGHSSSGTKEGHGSVYNPQT